MRSDRTLAVVGLGYVGLPVAVAFSRAFRVIGFDVDGTRIDDLRRGHDRTGEVDSDALRAGSLEFSADPARLREANFYVVAVPTPVDGTNRPDLGPLLGAAATVGAALSKGDVVVFESTVYPGATELDCVPVLERTSGLRFGEDFTVGYSPERINPGDREHRLENVVKVVSGSDPATAALVAEVYGAIVRAGVHVAPNIRTAEAAKVIENTQRDLNIALMNELAVLFKRLDIDTLDVLAAAATKWNFLPFRPGLVGGHCIGVDPYYLTHRAESVGYHPEVILAGRRINDAIGGFLARETMRLLSNAGVGARQARVGVLGLTFKEDCPDLRNTRVVDIVRELAAWGVRASVSDPLASADAAAHEYGLALTPLDDQRELDALVLAVSHRAYRALSVAELASRLRGPRIVVDVKGIVDRAAAREAGITLYRM